MRIAARSLSCARGGAVLLSLVFAIGFGPASAATDPDAVAREVVRDLDLQASLPIEKEEPIASEFHWRIPEDAAELILWAALIFGTGVVAWAMLDNVPIWRRGRRLVREADPGKEPWLSVERLEEAQLDADDLARRGKIVEAMHLLLLRSLAELRRSLGLSFADSLTSREILRRLRLPEMGLASFADIVRRVELVYFGKRQASEDDYNACRRSFAELVGAVRDTANG